MSPISILLILTVLHYGQGCSIQDCPHTQCTCIPNVPDYEFIFFQKMYLLECPRDFKYSEDILPFLQVVYCVDAKETLICEEGQCRLHSEDSSTGTITTSTIIPPMDTTDAIDSDIVSTQTHAAPSVIPPMDTTDAIDSGIGSKQTSVVPSVILPMDTTDVIDSGIVSKQTHAALSAIPPMDTTDAIDSGIVSTQTHVAPSAIPPMDITDAIDSGIVSTQTHAAPSAIPPMDITDAIDPGFVSTETHVAPVLTSGATKSPSTLGGASGNGSTMKANGNTTSHEMTVKINTTSSYDIHNKNQTFMFTIQVVFGIIGGILIMTVPIVVYVKCVHAQTHTNQPRNIIYRVGRGEDTVIEMETFSVDS